MDDGNDHSQLEFLAPDAATPPARGCLGVVFLDTTNRLRIGWRFLLFGIGLVGIQLFAGLVVVVGVLIWGPPTDDFNRHLQALSDNDAFLMAIGALLGFPPVLGLVAACRMWLDRRSLASAGFVWPERRLSASVFGGLLAGMLAIGVPALVGLACGGFEWRGFTPTWNPLLLFVPLVLAAFIEELLVRSYLLQNFIDIRRPWLGIILTSVFFWLIHSFNPHVWSSPFVGLNLFAAGVLLSLAYLASGNIWFPTALHFAWNYTQGPLLNIPISGMNIEGVVNLKLGDVPDWLTGGKFGLEGSALCTMAQIVGGVVFYCIWKSRRGSHPVGVEHHDVVAL